MSAPFNPTRHRATDVADRVGMVSSLLCALHCALLPLALAAAPALGLGVLGGADIDQMVTVFASVLGIGSLGLGYRRHRTFHALALLLPGLALLWLGSFSDLHTHDARHVIMMTVGGLLIAAAHLYNLRLTHRWAGIDRR